MTELIRPLLLTGDLYGRAEGDAPAAMFQRADQPPMMPGSLTTTIDGQDINAIWEEFQVRLAAYNSIAETKTSLLTFPVQRPTDKVGVPRNPGFQEATEYGRPTKIRVEWVTRSFPLAHYDLGYGYTQEFLDGASAAQILAVEAEVRAAWSALVRNRVMEAIFTEDNATVDGLTIMRLYNGDGEVPPKFKRWSHDGAHTHYLYDEAATVDADVLDAMEEHLVHHGFTEFGSNLILLANRTDMDDIRGLDDYVPAQSADRPTIIAGPVVGPTPQPTALQIQGYHGLWAIVEDNDIPSAYLLGFATGGAFAQRNPVGLREHENASARGLRLVEGNRKNYPLIDSAYDGYVGAGVRQRGAAVVCQVNVSAYETPSFATAV